MTFVSFLNNSLSILTILAQVFAFVLVIFLIKNWKNLASHSQALKLRTYAPYLALLAALLSVLGSLSYSDIIGYEPCKLCWIQRIFMYPSLILILIALAKQHIAMIAHYLIWLSGIGALIALYHYLIQLGLVSSSCSVVGYSVSCSERFVLQYGYITIPMMAFTAFLLVFLSSIIILKTDK